MPAFLYTMIPSLVTPPIDSYFVPMTQNSAKICKASTIIEELSKTSGAAIHIAKKAETPSTLADRILGDDPQLNVEGKAVLKSWDVSL